jgi:hypothetical protein
MNARFALMAVLIAAMAFYALVVPRIEGEGTVVPRARQK